MTVARTTYRTGTAATRSGEGSQDVHALLQQPEVRAALLVDRDELAVQDKTVLDRQPGDVGVGAGDVASLRL